MKNYWAQIDKALRFHENKSFQPLTIEWINDRIDWCEKNERLKPEQIKEFRERSAKIVEKQKNGCK